MAADAVIGQMALDRLAIVGMQMQLHDGRIGQEAVDDIANGSGREGRKELHGFHRCRSHGVKHVFACGASGLEQAVAFPQCLHDVRRIGPFGRIGLGVKPGNGLAQREQRIAEA
ncbi:MAG TPA: hypothetical protein DCM36_00645 [Xanthomonadaceae bacterium]|nr:hypothetical protein [Xanthomonadaceae bacterium]